MRRFPGVLAAALLVSGLAVLPSAPAAAVNAQLTFEGSARAYSGTVLGPIGFPATTFTSDSAGGNVVGAFNGGATWQPLGTPLADAFSEDRTAPYLGLRPRANNAASPSDTTYVFDGGSPAAGWGFALGDIEAERLTISATRLDGSAATVDELGFQGGYNTCDFARSSANCSSNPPVNPVPTAVPEVIDPAATELVVADTITCASLSSCDTAGASVAFLPTVPLSTLTVRSTWIVGLPTYQTWFAMADQPVAGIALNSDRQPEPGMPVELVDDDGSVLESTTTDEAGSYVFPSVLEGADLALRLPDTATSCMRAGADVPVSVDGSPAPELVATALAGVSGVVTDQEGTALAGVTVTAARDGVRLDTTTTGTGGSYELTALTDGPLTVNAEGPAGVAPVTAEVVLDCADIQIAPLALQLPDDGPGQEPAPGEPGEEPAPSEPGPGAPQPETPDASTPSAPAAPAADATQTSDQLADTGAHTWSAFAAAGSLLVFGVLLAAAGARRRADH